MRRFPQRSAMNPLRVSASGHAHTDSRDGSVNGCRGSPPQFGKLGSNAVIIILPESCRWSVHAFADPRMNRAAAASCRLLRPNIRAGGSPAGQEPINVWSIRASLGSFLEGGKHVGTGNQARSRVARLRACPSGHAQPAPRNSRAWRGRGRAVRRKRWPAAKGAGSIVPE
jgi:hypothetical protein